MVLPRVLRVSLVTLEAKGNRHIRRRVPADCCFDAELISNSRTISRLQVEACMESYENRDPQPAAQITAHHREDVTLPTVHKCRTGRQFYRELRA